MNTLVHDAAHMLVSGHINRLNPPAYHGAYGNGMEFGKRMAGKMILQRHCRNGVRARREVRKYIREWIVFFKNEGRIPGKAVAS